MYIQLCLILLLLIITMTIIELALLGYSTTVNELIL